MNARLVRVAMTQTVNAYGAMPTRIDDLAQLSGRLEDVRLANVEHHLALMEAAAKLGVRAIGLGELFTGPYFALHDDPMWIDLAEDAWDGPTVLSLRAGAKQHGMVVVAPIYERDALSGKRFNTAVVIDADGQVLGTYRKTHIPNGSNELGSFFEKTYYERSNGKNRVGASDVATNPFFPIFTTAIGRVGVAICYDRHFDGVMLSLALEGAEIVFCPAVTFGEKSQRMWPVEFAVDAARHNLFIGGSNRKGTESPWNQPFFGDSHFVGPNGRLEDLSTHPNLIVSDVDFGELYESDPSGWDFPRDIRHDIYSHHGRRVFDSGDPRSPEQR
jgi:beta-ureidopropionase